MVWEVKWLNVEVKQVLSEVLHGGSLKLLDWLLHDAKHDLQVSGMLRFVSWVSHSLRMNSDYG